MTFHEYPRERQRQRGKRNKETSNSFFFFYEPVKRFVAFRFWCSFYTVDDNTAEQATNRVLSLHRTATCPAILSRLF